METPRPSTPGSGAAYAQPPTPPKPPTPPNQGTGPAVDQAKDTAQQVVGQVQDTGKQVVEQVQQQAMSRASEQIGRVTETIGSVAEATRSVSGQLRQQDQAMVADYVEKAAGQLERFAGYLENKDVPELVSDVDRFARRQPALFMGGAFVLGLMAARFFKSSGSRGSYDGYDRPRGYGEPGYYNPYASGYATGAYPTRGTPQPPMYGGTASPAPRGANVQPTTRGASPQPPPYEPTV